MEFAAFLRKFECCHKRTTQKKKSEYLLLKNNDAGAAGRGRRYNRYIKGGLRASALGTAGDKDKDTELCERYEEAIRAIAKERLSGGKIRTTGIAGGMSRPYKGL
ncbi:MAG: hypothetical protein LUG14_06310, partial [Synergistaceae bacterium]|nr:hypothetical protein [Synergistaceae bacterium]